jgi:hypothetical protein
MVHGEREWGDHRISMTIGDDKIKLEGYSTVKLRPHRRPQLLGPWHLCAPGEPDYRIDGDAFDEKQRDFLADRSHIRVAPSGVVSPVWTER